MLKYFHEKNIITHKKRENIALIKQVIFLLVKILCQIKNEHFFCISTFNGYQNTLHFNNYFIILAIRV